MSREAVAEVLTKEDSAFRPSLWVIEHMSDGGVRIGGLLIRAREILGPYGLFDEWCAEHVPYSKRICEECIQVAGDESQKGSG
jgi:hypothetical protein